MLSDVRLAARGLARSSGFTAVAVIILGLGIGGATAVFSIVNAVLLRALPYAQSDRIVAVTTGATGNVSGGDYLDLVSGVSAFEQIAYYYGGQINVRTRNGAEFANTQFTAPSFFAILGPGTLIAGRAFDANDAAPAAIVTADFAERKFGGAAAAIGQNIIAYEKQYAITGVLATAAAFPPKANIWLRANAKPDLLERTAHNYKAIARLAGGQSREAAQAQLDTIGRRLRAQFPSTHERKFFMATDLAEFLSTGAKDTLRALLAAVLVLLLIACANVANLLLARGAARTRELAVRAALGASAWAIVRYLLIESFVLAAIAGSAGLLLARLTIGAMVALAPPGTPRLDEVSIDTNVLLFTAALALAATILFGLMPAWQSARIDVQSALKQGGGLRGTVSGSNRLRQTFVVVEIALALALAVSAALIFRSFLRLNEVDLGFRKEGVLVAYAAVPANNSDAAQLSAARWFAALPGKLAAIPGVAVSSAAMGVPSGAYASGGSFAVEGRSDLKTSRRTTLPTARFRLTGERYFETIGIPRLAGRDFTIRDTHDAPSVAIVSKSLADRIFGGNDALGKRIACGFDRPEEWMTIVGIVGDVRSSSPLLEPAAELYMPYQQHLRFADELQVVIRTSLDPAALTEPVRRTILADKPDVALRFQTLDAMVSESIALPRFRTVLLGGFSLLAALLALVGVYGVMSYVVEQRRGEFGVRLALGATGADLARLTLTGALKLAAIGITLGLGLAFAAQFALLAFLFGIDPVDAVSWFGSIGGLALIALIAAWIPARRAAALNPADVLRGE
jgi:predicted permease